MNAGISEAINCPQCGSPFSFLEGTRNATCPSCRTVLAVSGESGVSRFYIEDRLDLPEARAAARKFLSTSGVDPLVVEALRFERGELCFLPFWCMRALAVGWRWLERETVVREEVCDENGYRRVETKRGANESSFETITSHFDYSIPAFDSASFGLMGIAVAGTLLPLKAMNYEALSRRGTVFDILKGADQIRKEALAAARDRSMPEGVIRGKDDVRICGEKLALISYPVWRLSFRNGERFYPIVVDAVNARILKGRFPGRVTERLSAPMVTALTLVYAFTLHRAVGFLITIAFIIWLFSSRGMSFDALTDFFFRLKGRNEDVEHG